MSWQRYKLRDLCESVDYGLTASASDKPIGPKFLRITDIRRNSLDWSEVPFVDIDSEDEAKYQLNSGDIVIARTGAFTGHSAFIQNPPRSVFASYLVRLKAHFDQDPRFLYYFLQSHYFKEHLEGVIGGSAQPNASAKALSSAIIDIPPLKEQRAISSVLGALDDKIELNRQTARTLEELAQRLFKSWFVDFDPVRAKMAGRQPAHTPPEIADLFPDRLVDSPLGPIPEGWEFRPLADFADFVNGKNFTKNASGDGQMVIRIAELNSGPGARTVWNDVDADEKYVAEPGSILFAWSGSLGVYRWYRDSALINQHIFKVIPHDGISKAFCFQALQHLIEEFRQIAASKAVTMGHIKRSDLKEHGLYVPPDFRLVAAFSEIASPLWERALLLEQECETLAQLRDRLLPKLISGEIRVPEPEKMAEEA